MEKILTVLGIGPGNPDYLLPDALKAAKRAEVIAAGQRQFNTLIEADPQFRQKTWIPIGNGYPLKSTLEDLKESLKQQKKIAVAVSGDPGFHSLLKFLKNNLNGIDIKVIPGISSFQYLFSRLGLIYDHIRLMSLHGQKDDFDKVLKEGEELALLTDPVSSPPEILKRVLEVSPEKMVIVGENLSYPNERIYTLLPSAVNGFEIHQPNVVLILNKHENR